MILNNRPLALEYGIILSLVNYFRDKKNHNFKPLFLIVYFGLRTFAEFFAREKIVKFPCHS